MVFPDEKILKIKTLCESIAPDGLSFYKENKNKNGGMSIIIRLLLSIIFLFAAIIYAISPIDIIPDLLGPIGFVDDIMVWLIAIVTNIRILVGSAFQKGKSLSKSLKNRDGFFSEDI